MHIGKYVIILAMLGPVAAVAHASDADLIIYNADIYTVDAERSRSESIAVADGRILRVGTLPEMSSLRGDQTRMMDAGGRLMLPGLIDCHNHIRYGGDPNRVPLSGIENLTELKERIDQFLAERPDIEWIRGSGWVYSMLPEGKLPTAADLDAITGDRPALLTAYDGHTMWLNSEALRRIGIDRTTGNVGFGDLEKDELGEPTGIIFGAAGSGDDDDWAQFEAAVPQQSAEEAYQQLAANFARAARFGITTIVEPQAAISGLGDFERAYRDGDLQSRLRIALFHPPGTDDATVAKFAEVANTFGNERIKVSAIKLYIDDVIESQKAALLEPYSTDAQSRGEMFYESQDFSSIVTKLDAMELQLFIHAIGDRGIRTALDALEAARATNGERDARHQLVHVELLHPGDIPRFNKLGVVACMQPRHLAQDLTLQWAKAVGEERAKYAWALRSLLDSGAPLALSSDWPVAEMDPMVGIYTAVTRRSADDMPTNGWQPQQRITVAEAVAGYTEGGAYANHLDKELGSLEVGKMADLILLSQDIFNIPANQIKETSVVLTLVDGQEVYRDDDF